jgi:hypothetical protein
MLCPTPEADETVLLWSPEVVSENRNRVEVELFIVANKHEA